MENFLYIAFGIFNMMNFTTSKISHTMIHDVEHKSKMTASKFKCIRFENYYEIRSVYISQKKIKTVRSDEEYEIPHARKNFSPFFAYDSKLFANFRERGKTRALATLQGPFVFGTFAKKQKKKTVFSLRSFEFRLVLHVLLCTLRRSNLLLLPDK